MDTILISSIVLGLTQLAKITGKISSRFIPLTALLISAIVYGLASYFGNLVVDWVFISSAIVTALTSVGLWSSVKNTLE